MYKIQHRSRHLDADYWDENFFSSKHHFKSKSLAEKLAKAFDQAIEPLEYRAVPVHPPNEEVINIPRSEAGMVLISDL